MTESGWGISVVVPAHNEAAVIGRLLTSLLDDAGPGEFDVVVVANGCTDDTAAVARAFEPGVTVVETAIAGKHNALRLGDRHARHFPRLYVDADVVLDAASARRLSDTLRRPGVLAVAPHRRLETAGSPLIVRWYYQVWEMLPSVRDGLYGRGVIGVGREGHERLIALPEAMGDDLAASVAFPPDARRVVSDAVVRVHAPRAVRDLIKRRVRSVTATAQMAGIRPEDTGQARTSGRDLVALARRRPALMPQLTAFLAVTLVARYKARRPIRDGDFQTWLRDESSRTA